MLGSGALGSLMEKMQLPQNIMFINIELNREVELLHTSEQIKESYAISLSFRGAGDFVKDPIGLRTFGP